MYKRQGYGLAGNNRIGSYQSLALMNSVTAANGNGAQAVSYTHLDVYKRQTGTT